MQEPAFEGYLREEARAAEIFVAWARIVVNAGFLALVLLIIPFTSEAERRINVAVALLILMGVAYAAVVEVTVRLRYHTSVAYVTSAVDFLLVSLAVVAPLGSLPDALKTPTSAFYFVLIVFASLRLRPLLPVFVGGAAALVMFGLLAVALIREPDRVQVARLIDWNDPTISVLRVVTVATMFVTAGLLGAQVAGQARRALERSLQTLTFMYSDLRGFSEFVERRGDTAAAALVGEYRELVRGAVLRARGREMKTEGDSFLVEFRTSQQALACARAVLAGAESRSAAHPGAPLRIGIGLHAGEPVRHEGDYIGSAVNITARLGQVAGAGELLISDVVRGLLRTSGLPPTTERIGLSLKGIADPPHVYAVNWQEA